MMLLTISLLVIGREKAEIMDGSPTHHRVNTGETTIYNLHQNLPAMNPTHLYFEAYFYFFIRLRPLTYFWIVGLFILKIQLLLQALQYSVST